MKTITGQIITVEADGIIFGPGHVQFAKGDGTLVRALRTPFVTEVTEDQEP
ncbi:hypothetical protein [Brevibacterium sediminis]